MTIPAAEALKIHGTNLVELSVWVNDQAALAFVEAFKLLQQEGRLAKNIIEPIVSWRDETHHVVAAFASTTRGAVFLLMQKASKVMRTCLYGLFFISIAVNMGIFAITRITRLWGM